MFLRAFSVSREIAVSPCISLLSWLGNGPMFGIWLARDACDITVGPSRLHRRMWPIYWAAVERNLDRSRRR